ncbi:MAG: hypothetical protein L6R40_000649 [Gallowayella cf. fulva]|nr:MAG: hypothetical protein L6R40_000649 [Xanthomendoza cf. fulva]
MDSLSLSLSLSLLHTIHAIPFKPEQSKTEASLRASSGNLGRDCDWLVFPYQTNNIIPARSPSAYHYTRSGAGGASNIVSLLKPHWIPGSPKESGWQRTFCPAPLFRFKRLQFLSNTKDEFDSVARLPSKERATRDPWGLNGNDAANAGASSGSDPLKHVPINVRRSTDFPNFPCLDLTFLLEFEDLRERLLAQGMHGSNGQTLQRIDHQPSSHASIHPHDQNIDPAIAGSGLINAGAGDSGADGNQSDGKKGKRELSTSKRAAQNRAAQRAFRQRKEGHIKKLETQVQDYNTLSESFKALQAENYQLRDYIISLQSRLIESHGEFPQPPSNIDINPQRSSAPLSQSVPAPTAPMGSSAISQLRASAAQVIDLSSGKHDGDDPDETLQAGSPASKRAKPDVNLEGIASSSDHQPPDSTSANS